MSNIINIGGGAGGGGGDASKRELTWSQYQALTEAEKNNGTMYFITDINGDGSQFQPFCYSTDEREIGVWVDGKPLYEKSYNTNLALTNGTWVVVDSTQTGIHLIGALTICEDVLESQISVMADSTYGLRVQIQINKNRTMTNIVIRYTKNADTAGSGTWTPQGVPAVHYSTEEQIVGTWIDGKTLYEKTIVYSGSIAKGTYAILDNTLMYGSNVDYFTVISSSAKLSGVNSWFTQGSKGGTLYEIALSDTLGVYVENFAEANLIITDVVVTIRYTKSTS